MKSIGMILLFGTFLLTSIGCQQEMASKKSEPAAPDQSKPEKIRGEWGHLTGQIVFAGEQIPPREIVPDRPQDRELLENSNVKLFDRSFLVDSKNNGIQDIFVMMYFGRDPELGKKVQVHPDVDSTQSDRLELVFKSFQYESAAYIGTTQQEIWIKNEDGVGISPRFPMGPISGSVNAPADDPIRIGRIQKPQRLPSIVECNMFPWVKSRILIRHEPYNTTTLADGSFEIKNLPVGKHRFQFWHSRYLNLENENGKRLTDRRGVIEIEIKPNRTTELGKLILKGKP